MKPQFSLRGLMLITLAIAIAMPLASSRRPPDDPVRAIYAMGGTIAKVIRPISSTVDLIPGLDRLDTLDASMFLVVHFESLSDDNLCRVSESIGSLPNLKRLSLANTQLTDESVATLSTFKCLSALDLSGTMVTQRGISILKSQLVNCEITY